MPTKRPPKRYREQYLYYRRLPPTDEATIGNAGGTFLRFDTTARRAPTRRPTPTRRVTPMPTPINHFTARAAAVAEALAMTYAAPDAAEDMRAADARINDKLADLDAHLAPPSSAELAAAGAAWATGKTKTPTKVLDLMARPTAGESATVSLRSPNGGWDNRHVNTPETRRYAAVRKGAADALIAKADRPEWQAPALVESCLGDVRAWFTNVVTEATESLAALPEQARAHLMRTGRPADLIELIDPAVTATSVIEVYRRAAWAWEVIETTDLTAWNALARAVAHGDVSATPKPDADLGSVLGTDYRAHAALWFNADVMACRAFDVEPLTAVLEGYGELSPLIDPLGDDAEELERRLAVFNTAGAWLEHRISTVGDRAATALYAHEGYSRNAAVKRSLARHTLYERGGEGTVAESLAAFKAEHGRLFTTAPEGDDAAA